MTPTYDQIRRLVDRRYIDRGQDYVSRGRVQLTEVTTEALTATCLGSRRYTVTLRLNEGKLSGTCTCPAFDEIGPCKHMAAAALAAMMPAYDPDVLAKQQNQKIARIEARLMRMSKSDLRDLVQQLVPDLDELESWMSNYD